MPRIMTASWFAKLPAGTSPVGISRDVPRGKNGFHRLRALEPGPWFKSVSPDQYLTRYSQILDRLDPNAICDQLHAYGDMPALSLESKGSDNDNYRSRELKQTY